MEIYQLTWRERQLLDALEYAIDTEDQDKEDLIRAELSVTQQERDNIRAGVSRSTWF